MSSLSFTAFADPIRLHAENPRWLEWRGCAIVLIGSGEHYGAVINLDFDYRRYLEALERDGVNYTRLFTGVYVEPAGAFGITRNTLAPADGRFLAPWVRSDEPGYTGGGNKFDLDRFSPEYLSRLKDFLAEADRRGVVVELTFFSSTYRAEQWAVHPFNPINNVQKPALASWKELHVLPAPNGDGPGADLSSTAAGPYQERLVRHLVRALNAFDNLFFEIQNEPWSDHGSPGDFINPYLPDQYAFPNAVDVTSPASVAWQRAIAAIITDEESRLPKRHLIAQNVANFRLALRDADLVPEAGILAFHYAHPEAVEWNRGLGRVISHDETGFAGDQDATYRREAWNFVLSGGGVFNHLDYSFSVGEESGTDQGNDAPGGGGPTLRRQFKVLSDFIHGFDLAKLQPDPVFVCRAPGVVARVLSAPGESYALYLQGRAPTNLRVNLPVGAWTVEWISVEDGAGLKQEIVAVASAAVSTVLDSPDFEDAVALRIRRMEAAAISGL